MKNVGKYVGFVVLASFVVLVLNARAAGVAVSGNSNALQYVDTTLGTFGIGTTTPIATLQVTIVTANATTSIQLGKPNQNKGTCLTYYRTDGTPLYQYFPTGSIVPTYTATKPSGCQN